MQLRWAKETVDDGDKSVSIFGNAPPRRSTESLGNAMSLVRNKYIKWCTRSLRGHLIFFELAGGLPMLLWAVLTMQSEHTLSLAAFLQTALLIMVLVGIGSALLWYAITGRIVNSRDR